MIYRGKKTVLGKVRDRMEERRRKKEDERSSAELGDRDLDRQAMDMGNMPPLGFATGEQYPGDGSGSPEISSEQEQYSQNMYGIRPENLVPGQEPMPQQVTGDSVAVHLILRASQRTQVKGCRPLQGSRTSSTPSGVWNRN